LSPSSVAVRLAALRFFYCKTLKKGWSIAETLYPKRGHRLPAILSQEEAARLIQPHGLVTRVRIFNLLAGAVDASSVNRQNNSDGIIALLRL